MSSDKNEMIIKGITVLGTVASAGIVYLTERVKSKERIQNEKTKARVEMLGKVLIFATPIAATTVAYITKKATEKDELVIEQKNEYDD